MAAYYHLYAGVIEIAVKGLTDENTVSDTLVFLAHSIVDLLLI